jgi:hypothetical protein
MLPRKRVRTPVIGFLSPGVPALPWERAAQRAPA